ncbi:MAG: SRPBCC family protein [Nocardioidaceae bacterium]
MDADPVTSIDVIDEVFVAAQADVLRARLCDEARWERWFPGVQLCCVHDRGSLGKRGRLTGALVGTAEIWLEAVSMGTVVHAFLQADTHRRHDAEGVRAPVRGTLLHGSSARSSSRSRSTSTATVARGSRLPASPGPRRQTVGSATTGAHQTSSSADRRDPMASQTTSDIVIDASPGTIMAIIADFKSYPSWATGVKETEVLQTGVDGRAEEVRFVLDAPPIRDEYTLSYEWHDDDEVTWSLSEPGKMLRAMDGAYVLGEQSGAHTRVTYRLAVDVSIPLLGMLKRKAEKVIIDTALKGLKKRAEQGS